MNWDAWDEVRKREDERRKKDEERRQKALKELRDAQAAKLARKEQEKKKEKEREEWAEKQKKVQEGYAQALNKGNEGEKAQPQVKLSRGWGLSNSPSAVKRTNGGGLYQGIPGMNSPIGGGGNGVGANGAGGTGGTGAPGGGAGGPGRIGGGGSAPKTPAFSPLKRGFRF